MVVQWWVEIEIVMALMEKMIQMLIADHLPGCNVSQGKKLRTTLPLSRGLEIRKTTVKVDGEKTLLELVILRIS